MKESICMYCEKKVLVPLKSNHKTSKCDLCHKIWHNFRTKYSKYGDGVTAHELVIWRLCQDEVCVECGSTENLTNDRIVPGSKGGKYSPDNMQLLCYSCNCTKKIAEESVKEGIKGDESRECTICKKVLPLNSKYFHKLSYKPVHRKNALSMYHPSCRLCRLAKLREAYVPTSNRLRKARVTNY